MAVGDDLSVQFYSDLEHALADGIPPTITAEFARDIIAMLEAPRHSHGTGGTVAIPTPHATYPASARHARTPGLDHHRFGEDEFAGLVAKVRGAPVPERADGTRPDGSPSRCSLSRPDAPSSSDSSETRTTHAPSSDQKQRNSGAAEGGD